MCAKGGVQSSADDHFDAALDSISARLVEHATGGSLTMVGDKIIKNYAPRIETLSTLMPLPASAYLRGGFSTPPNQDAESCAA